MQWYSLLTLLYHEGAWEDPSAEKIKPDTVDVIILIFLNFIISLDFTIL